MATFTEKRLGGRRPSFARRWGCINGKGGVSGSEAECVSRQGGEVAQEAPETMRWHAVLGLSLLVFGQGAR